MKFICVGRNYAEHAKEMHHDLPTDPVVFLKPSTALLQNNKVFHLPEFSREMHHECELIFRICKNGKHIAEKFAMKYVDAVSVGIDFTARDLQSAQKKKGLPWEISKAFDHSAVVGEWQPLPKDISKISFSLLKNKETVQSGNAADMIFSIPKIISYCSQYFSFKQGDILFTGTPEGVSAVGTGDVLEGFLEGERVMRCKVV